MKVKVEYEVRPFSVPNFVLVDYSLERRQDGVEDPQLALHEVSAEALSAMCDQFREDVFKKAKKNQPAVERCKCQR